ncbi:MAG: LicD family protein [Clostridiales bacterium]|nr:LicD family protein [Clostridiales bacterium]
MENQRLKELQKVEFEVLTVVDKFCRENDINYSVYAGTALGAVRHGGFIPWDDDIDICMDRNVYKRFVKLWRENPVKGYTLATDEDPGCHINHGKVYKDGVVWSPDGKMQVSGSQGVFVDIFPLDKVPTDKKKRKKLLRKAKLRLVYTRDIPYRNGSKFLNLVSRILLMKPKKYKLKLKQRYHEYIQQYRDMEDNFVYMGLERPGVLGFSYPKDLFETSEIKFEQINVLITNKSDEFLTTMYGDYMQLPPEEERVCKHNPEITYLNEAQEENTVKQD